MDIWKLCAFAALSAAGCSAQTCTITSPTSGQVLSGFDGTNFTISLSGVSNSDHVQYYVDGYPAYNPGTGPASILGLAPANSGQTFPFPSDSYWDLNGPHVLTAYVYNILNSPTIPGSGTLLATCTQAFSTSNNWPNPNAPTLAITPGTALGSNWSGRVNLTATLSGTGAGSDSVTFYFYVDGILQNAGALTTTAAFVTYVIDTTLFPNGYHTPAVVVVDNNSGTTYPTAYVGASNEWSASAPGVNFQNGTVASQAITSAHDIFLGLSGTYTLSVSILNTDGTTTAVSSPAFYSANPSVASVNASTGVITAASSVMAGHAASAAIYAMAPTVSSTDLASNGTYTNAQVADTAHPFTASMLGWIINVTGGTNAIPGQYIITHAGNNGIATLNAPCMTAASTNIQATWGPTRQDWAFVWPTNTLPHFAKNGAILTSYNAATSYVPHEVFKGINWLLNDQPYNPGAGTDLGNGAIHTMETELGYQAINGGEAQSTWEAAENAYIANFESVLTPYPALNTALTIENFTTNNQSLWGTANGNPSTWNPAGLTYAFEQANSYGNILFVPAQDEVNSSVSAPLWGPITYGGANSWLQSITCNGTTCTANAPGWIINASRQFIIHGSSVTGMNSTPGSLYAATSLGANSFSFPSTAAAGTYGVGGTTDSGFTLEPLADGWFASNTAYALYSSYASVRSQFLAANVPFKMDWPNAGGTDCPSLTAWGALSQQTIGSITHISDYGTQYESVGALAYLAKRVSANELLGAGELGTETRQFYGCWSPSLPLLGETKGSSLAVGDSGYGTRGYPVNITSTSGNLVTFASDSKIRSIFPGLTRLTISGATDTGSPTDSTNGNFFVSDCPTIGPASSTCHLLLEMPDFEPATGAGGTITMADGSAWPLSNIQATSNQCNAPFNGVNGTLCGQVLTLASGSTTFRRERGQTFTLSGVSGASNWNTATFQLLAENLNVTNSLSQYFYRQVPSLSATGGTAQIVRNETYIKGATGSADLFDRNPGNSFDSVMECMILRCAGERTYQGIGSNNGYSDQLGFTNPALAVTYLRQFPASGGGGLTVPGTLHMNPHFENATAVPNFHAVNSADLMWNRWQKYIMQPALNSPDYGPYIECAARTGSYGDILFCWNATDAQQNVTFNLSPYLQSGQQIIVQPASEAGIGPITLLATGTTSTTVTLPEDSAIFLVFPATFAGELTQPAIAPRLTDVADGAAIAIRFSYDPYWIDVGPTYNCSAGACMPGWDRNIGPIWYRILYLRSDGSVCATSDIQQL